MASVTARAWLRIRRLVLESIALFLGRPSPAQQEIARVAAQRDGYRAAYEHTCTERSARVAALEAEREGYRRAYESACTEHSRELANVAAERDGYSTAYRHVATDLVHARAAHEAARDGLLAELTDTTQRLEAMRAERDGYRCAYERVATELATQCAQLDSLRRAHQDLEVSLAAQRAERDRLREAYETESALHHGFRSAYAKSASELARAQALIVSATRRAQRLEGAVPGAKVWHAPMFLGITGARSAHGAGDTPSVDPQALRAHARLVLMHIGRTGGTSLVRMLEQACAGRNLVHVDPTQFDTELEFIREAEVICGHFGYAHVARLCGPILAVSVVRNPLDRVLSSYAFLRGYSESPSGENIVRVHEAKQLSLAQWVESETPETEAVLCDHQSAFFAGDWRSGRRVAKDWRALLEAALENSRNFALVGINERLPESVGLLAALVEPLMGVRMPIDVPHANASEDRSDAREVPAAVVRTILSRNRADVAFYEAMAARFEQAVRAAGDSLRVAAEPSPA